MDGDVARRFVTIQNGDCRISLYQGYLDPAETQLIFWQGDVERIVDALAEQSIPLERDLERDPTGAASALLRDPDGHPIYLVNMATETAKTAFEPPQATGVAQRRRS